MQATERSVAFSSVSSRGCGISYLLRQRCPAMMQDRYLAPDIEAATAAVLNGQAAGVLRQLAGLPALWVAA
jgi:histidine ammonia-lyase